MGVLFIMPQWAAPSELWMQRMIEAIEPHIVAIGCPSPTEKIWRNRIPAFALQDSPPNFLRRLSHRLRIPVWLKPRETALDVLRNAIADPSVTTVLINYLEDALQFEDVWASTPKPVFVHCHGCDVTWDWRLHESPDRCHFPFDYVQRARRLGARVTFIANSASTAQRLLSIGIQRERIQIKYYGIPAPSAPPPHLLQTTGLQILYLGRLIDFKGPDLVIRAFEMACDQGLDATLTLAGDGPLRLTCELLQRRSRYRERIRLLGAINGDQGEKLRAEADIFTAHNYFGPLSHQEEAFGVSVVEAMAAALPVVSGRNGSLSETVVDGETGILVEPGDVAAHAQAFLRLAADPALRRQMGEAGWRRAREHFSVEQERTSLLRILGLPNPSTCAF